MKKFVLIISLISLLVINCAFTINGGVSYTVETARIESFDKTSNTIDISKYYKYFFDENFQKNIELLNTGRKKYKNRYLTLFSDQTYSIRYRSEISISYYYDVQGNLTNIDFDMGDKFPCKRICYDIKGNLDSVTLDISKHEQFVFDANKKLIAHWIGNNCYNEKGELIMTRE